MQVACGEPSSSREAGRRREMICAQSPPHTGGAPVTNLLPPHTDATFPETGLARQHTQRTPHEPLPQDTIGAPEDRLLQFAEGTLEELLAMDRPDR